MTLDDASKIARENNPKVKHYRLDAETGVLKRPLPHRNIQTNCVGLHGPSGVEYDWFAVYQDDIGTPDPLMGEGKTEEEALADLLIKEKETA